MPAVDADHTEMWVSVSDVPPFVHVPGSELAACCDLVYVASDARIGYPAVRFGVPDMQFHPWLMGMRRAMELMLLAKPVTADQALAMGMVTEVVDDDAALSTAQALASRMATGPTTGYAKIKEALLRAAGTNLDEALEAEDAAQSQLGATADHHEAVDAFVAKRTPTFTGR